MKPLLALAALTLVTACVSASEFDRDQAYSKCDSISDKSSRDRCIADAIRQSERDRADQAERQTQQEENAERRAIGREIAGVGND